MSTEAEARKQDDHTGKVDYQILRQILCSVEGNAKLSQRQLSGELGIALGSVNWYLKRCLNKGLIKISQAPLKRYAYYLTPKGMEEKGRLMAQYLKWSLDFFRLGREESAAILSRCIAQGHKEIILVGNSDLAEIFIMSAIDLHVKIHAIYEAGQKSSKRLHVPIVGTLPKTIQYVYILTDLSDPQKTYDLMRAQGIEEKSIMIPELLYFRPLIKEST
jgi:DNA-binding MarR family transcriptional regulator